MQSAAGTDKMYATGDAITVRVTFPKTIQSAMGASLNIQIGENTRAATASDCSNCGTTYLDFSYTVAAGDYDANGVTVATDALSATALTHSHAGTPHAFTLTLPNTLARPQGNHRVNLGDYDQDDDGLIEVSTLDHLNAIRWDLDGDGGVSSGNSTNYANAFLSRAADMGCPTNSQDADNNDCAGYELAENLDFDTDGDGDVDSNDAYSNWTPIGALTSSFGATFDGNNKTVSNLKINSSSNSATIGLFGRVGGKIIGTGLVDADITTSGAGNNLYVGALAGVLDGTALASYATGAVSQTGTGNQGWVGGLAGYVTSGGTIAAGWSGVNVSSAGSAVRIGGLAGNLLGTITAGYATGAVSATGNNSNAGGLAGNLTGVISASYATGPISYTGSGGGAGGVFGSRSGSTITSTYWDTNVTGIADDSDTNMPEGKTTSELQSAGGYDTGGIYENWNVNVDGQTGNDDPWDFGQRMQYPMLKFGGMSVVAQNSLAMGMPSSNGNHPVVGETAGVCLINGPAIRLGVPAGTGLNGGNKSPWRWQRSTDGKTWSDITEDGGPTVYYTPVSGDVGYYLRSCVFLNDTAPEGADEACVRMFAKVKAAGG